MQSIILKCQNFQIYSYIVFLRISLPERDLLIPKNTLICSLFKFSLAMVNSNRKRKVLTLEERIRVIKFSNKGESARKIALSIGVGKTQIQSIIREKESILKEWKSGESSNRKYSKARKTPYSDLNKLVWDWFCVARSKRVPVSGTLLQ